MENPSFITYVILFDRNGKLAYINPESNCSFSNRLRWNHICVWISFKPKYVFTSCFYFVVMQETARQNVFHTFSPQRNVHFWPI